LYKLIGKLIFKNVTKFTLKVNMYSDLHINKHILRSETTQYKHSLYFEINFETLRITHFMYQIITS